MAKFKNCRCCKRRYKPRVYRGGEPSKFCSGRCRLRFFRRPSAAEKAQSLAALRKAAEEGLAWVLACQAEGRKWFRSVHANKLEALGLPGNCEVAAAVLGVSRRLLNHRLTYNMDILAPPAANSKSGFTGVRLKVPPASALRDIRIMKSEKRISD